MLRAPTHFVELGTTTKTKSTAATTTTRNIQQNNSTTKSTAATISFIQRWHIGKGATSPSPSSATETETKSTIVEQQQTTIPISEKFYHERTSLYGKTQQQETSKTKPHHQQQQQQQQQQKSSPIFTREHLTTKILFLTTPFSFKKTKKPKTLTTIETPTTTTTATTIAVDELTPIPKVTTTIQNNFCNNNNNINNNNNNNNNINTLTYPKQKNIIQKELEVQQQREKNQQPKSQSTSIVDIGIEKVSNLVFSQELSTSKTYLEINNTKNSNTNSNNNSIICNNNNNFDNNKENIIQNNQQNPKCNYLTANNNKNSNKNNNKSITDSSIDSPFNSSQSTSTTSSLSLSSSSSYKASQTPPAPKTLFQTKSTIKTSTTPPITNNLSTTTSTTSTSLNVVSPRMSPTSQTPTRTSLFDSCHRKIRLIGGGPVAFLGGLVAKARRKERDGDQNSTDTKLYLEESVLERKLPEADLKALVDLPAGLDYNEWLASHTLALFEHVNLVYGTISEFCTPSGCSDMTGPGNRTYLWFDEKGKKTRVAAPQYIDYVMTFTQKTVSDESIFPTKYANEFPSSFESIARKILRLQFHVIAHLYAAHFREIALLGLHTHLNLTFAHLTALHRRFNLIDEKETDVLRDLEVALRLTDDNSHSNSNSNTQASSETASMVTASSTSTSMASSDAHGGGVGGRTVSNHTNSLSNSTTSSLAAAAAAATGTVAAHCNALSSNHHASAVAAAVTITRDDINLQHETAASTSSTLNSTSATNASLIDGDAGIQPICTQPEAASKPAVFGGGDGLIGGILGDLSSGEFGDTTRYCTSAVPISSVSNSNYADDGGGGGGGVGVGFCAGNVVAGGLNSNNGVAATLHLNFNNNNHNRHYHHHHHAHHLLQQQQHHHQYQQHPYPHTHQQNSGLIQCNASNAPSAQVATAAATAAATSTASTSAA